MSYSLRRIAYSLQVLQEAMPERAPPCNPPQSHSSITVHVLPGKVWRGAPEISSITPRSRAPNLQYSCALAICSYLVEVSELTTPAAYAEFGVVLLALAVSGAVAVGKKVYPQPRNEKVTTRREVLISHGVVSFLRGITKGVA